jgi:tetratricopeptide (TPR) repeat protein
MGRVDGEAEALYERARQACVDSLGEGHLHSVAAAARLGGLYEATGRAHRALPLLQAVAEADAATAAAGDEAVAASQRSLGKALLGMGLKGLAATALQNALDAKQKRLGAQHPSLHEDLRDLAELYLSSGKYERAEHTLTQLLQLVRAAHTNTNGDNADAAAALNALGRCAKLQGDAILAERRHREAHEMLLRVHGDASHPDCAASTSLAAAALAAMGRLEEARDEYERALQRTVQAHGEWTGAAARVQNDLGVVQWRLGNLDEAERLYRRALAIQEDLGEEAQDVAPVLNNLATLLCDQDRYDMALPLHRRAVDIDQRRLGPDHPDVALTLNNLATLYCEHGKTAEAAGMHRRALAIQQTTLGRAHPATAATLHALGLLLTAADNHVEAERVLRGALAVREATLGEDHLDTAQTVNGLGLVLAGQVSGSILTVALEATVKRLSPLTVASKAER